MSSDAHLECDPVHAPRHLTALLAAALLALAPGSALAQSAGDEQYSDPLAQTDTGSSTTPPPVDAPSLSDGPQQQDTAPDTSSGEQDLTAPPPPSEGTEAAPAQLPNTGADTGELAIIGAVLMLLGIGLRLRTADARP